MSVRGEGGGGTEMFKTSQPKLCPNIPPKSVTKILIDYEIAQII